jgi:hypothetical protein
MTNGERPLAQRQGRRPRGALARPSPQIPEPPPHISHSLRVSPSSSCGRKISVASIADAYIRVPSSPTARALIRYHQRGHTHTLQTPSSPHLNASAFAALNTTKSYSNPRHSRQNQHFAPTYCRFPSSRARRNREGSTDSMCSILKKSSQSVSMSIDQQRSLNCNSSQAKSLSPALRPHPLHHYSNYPCFIWPHTYRTPLLNPSLTSQTNRSEASHRYNSSQPSQLRREKWNKS